MNITRQRISQLCNTCIAFVLLQFTGGESQEEKAKKNAGRKGKTRKSERSKENISGCVEGISVKAEGEGVARSSRFTRRGGAAVDAQKKRKA